MTEGEGVALGGFVAMLDPDERAALLDLGRVRRYRRGATLLLQGARDDIVCVILEGRVKVTLHFLIERADAQPEHDLDIALTQEELASHIASSRESVVRALTALRTRGLIETSRRQITIRDVEGLRAYAG